MIREEFKKVLDDIKRAILSEKEIGTSIIENTISLLKDIERSAKDKTAVDLVRSELKVVRNLLEKVKMYNLEIKIGRGIKEGFNKEMISELLGDLKIDVTARDIRVGIVSKDIPKFKGIDGVNYGPFKSGDIILINKNDYILLKEKGFIKEVYIEK